MLKVIEDTKKEPVTPERAPFPDACTVEAIPIKKGALYVFRDQRGYEVAKYPGALPLSLTDLSTVGKEIKKHLNPEGRFSKEAILQDFENIKVCLNEYLESYQLESERAERLAEEEDEATFQANIDSARELLRSKDFPLIYIASLVTWKTAGERNNIMLTFIAYASQVVLKTPISVIGLGEGASGKTHIQEEALNLIPREFVKHEKSIKEAAMFNRAKEDPFYYDGAIVNYGDMGGQNSQDFVMEAKNLLKELQSDGFVNKPLNIPGDDGWRVEDITLYGYPALTYTTVPGFQFDDQELSRSIFITPRMDNKAVFNARKKILEFKGGRTYQQLQSYERDLALVPYMVYVLREELENLTIINPYTETIIQFLGESEYFKRDFDKYNSILKVITAFHALTRQVFEQEGEKILFTSLDDIKIFFSLLRPYHESISGNISPKAAEILDIIRANLEEWIFQQKISEFGSFSINEFMELTRTNLAKRSVRRYFGELNNAGIIKVVGNEGRANTYQLTDRELGSGLLLQELTEEQKNLIEWEFGPAALQFIELDAPHNGMAIELPDPEVEVPGWDRYDHKK